MTSLSNIGRSLSRLRPRNGWKATAPPQNTSNSTISSSIQFSSRYYHSTASSTFSFYRDTERNDTIIPRVQSTRFRNFGSSTVTSTAETTAQPHPKRTILSSSQALVLKQEDDELSPTELDLKNALQRHEHILNDNSSNNNHNNNSDLIASLNTVRDALEALEYWEDSLRIEEELEGHARSALELAACIFRQGKLFVRQQNDLYGLARYKKALEIFSIEHNRSSSINDDNSNIDNDNQDDDDEIYYHADIGNVTVAIAGVFFSQGNIDQCLQTLESAEDHFRHHGTKKSDHGWFASSSPTAEPHVDLVKCLDNQGMMLRLKEDYWGALDKYEEALDVLGDRDYTKRQSLQLHTADMLKCVDDVDGAILSYEKILKEDRKRRDSDEETALDGVILQSLGLLHSQQRQLELAEQELSQALEVQQRFLGDRNQEVSATFTALGSVHGIQGQKRKALECFQQALLIERMYAEDDNEPQVLHILRNISVLHGEKVPKWDL